MPLKSYKKVIETLFRIPNKRGEIVPFILNNVQEELDRTLELRNDILKARQFGVTSYVMARFLVECMQGFARVVMIAHDRDHTERLLARARLFLQLMKGEKPIMGRESESELVFKKTNASFYIGTAGSKQFGRSDTITHLHCSEVAFWKDPKSLMKGLFQAVPHDSGIVIKESTANGYGTYHHRQYSRARSGESRFKPFFFPWHIFPEYKSESSLNSQLTDEEVQIKKDYNLSDRQIQWRREKIQDDFEGDELQFHQEYPSNPDEAFLLSGGSLFPQKDCSYSSKWIREKSPVQIGIFKILEGHPNPDLHYTIGADSAGGTGNDYSVAEVFCVESSEEVAKFSSNKVSPPTFALVLAFLGKKFSHNEVPAYLVPERNSHGISVVALLKESEPYESNSHRLFKDLKPGGGTAGMLVPKAGFVTSGTSKYRLIGILQKLLPEMTIHDDKTMEEIRGFSETSLGTMTNKDAENDDCVIACALAALGILRERRMGVIKLVLPEFEKKDPYKTIPPVFILTFEDVVGSIKKKREGEKTIFGVQHRIESNNPFTS